MTSNIYLILCAFISVMENSHSLKLTPVQQLTQRIDLFSESKTIHLSLRNVLRKQKSIIISEIDFYEAVSEEDKKSHIQLIDQFLNSDEIAKLNHLIKRWGYVEDKLRQAIVPESSQQIFEDIIHDVASGKALVGHSLLKKSNLQKRYDEKYELQVQALITLESSCPSLWRLGSSWRSLNSDGWLDCFVSLNTLYSVFQRKEDSQMLERSLFNSVPWLLSVIDKSDLAMSNPKDKLNNTLRSLISLSMKDRELLSKEIKRAWKLSEGMRSSLKVLVDDFTRSSSNRIRLGIFTRSQQVTDEMLMQFTKTSKLIEETLSGSPSINSSIDINKLRSKLYDEILREALSYLFIMNSVLEKGEIIIQDLKINLKDTFKMQKLWKTSLESFSLPVSLPNGASAISYVDSINTIGFFGLSSILKIFETSFISFEKRESELLSSHNTKDTTISDEKSKTKKPRTFKASKTKTAEEGNKSSKRKKIYRNYHSEQKETNIRKEKKKDTYNYFPFYLFTSIVSYLICAAFGGSVLKKRKQSGKTINKTAFNIAQYLNKSSPRNVSNKPILSFDNIISSNLDINDASKSNLLETYCYLLYSTCEDIRLFTDELVIYVIKISYWIYNLSVTAFEYLLNYRNSIKEEDKNILSKGINSISEEVNRYLNKQNLYMTIAKRSSAKLPFLKADSCVSTGNSKGENRNSSLTTDSLNFQQDSNKVDPSVIKSLDFVEDSKESENPNGIVQIEKRKTKSCKKKKSKPNKSYIPDDLEIRCLLEEMIAKVVGVEETEIEEAEFKDESSGMTITSEGKHEENICEVNDPVFSDPFSYNYDDNFNPFEETEFDNGEWISASTHHHNKINKAINHKNRININLAKSQTSHSSKRQVDSRRASKPVHLLKTTINEKSVVAGRVKDAPIKLKVKPYSLSNVTKLEYSTVAGSKQIETTSSAHNSSQIDTSDVPFVNNNTNTSPASTNDTIVTDGEDSNSLDNSGGSFEDCNSNYEEPSRFSPPLPALPVGFPDPLSMHPLQYNMLLQQHFYQQQAMSPGPWNLPFIPVEEMVMQNPHQEVVPIMPPYYNPLVPEGMMNYNNYPPNNNFRRAKQNHLSNKSIPFLNLPDPVMFVPYSESPSMMSPYARDMHPQYQNNNYYYQENKAPSVDEIKAIVKNQIEYYFSAKNLMNDEFLKCKMDSEGYVELGEIMKFRRIANLRINAYFVYEALKHSSQLDILVTSEITAMLQEEQIDLASSNVENLINKTRIRSTN